MIVNVAAAADVPPPGAGLTTDTEALPTLAISLAAIAAVTCVALTKVVVRSEPFQRTTELETKLVPFTVNVNPEPPAVALVGEMVASVGAGLVMVKT